MKGKKKNSDVEKWGCGMLRSNPLKVNFVDAAIDRLHSSFNYINLRYIIGTFRDEGGNLTSLMSSEFDP